MIRCAALSDTAAIGAFLLRQKHHLGYLANVNIDTTRALGSLAEWITSPAAFVYVVTRDHVVDGVMIAQLAPLWCSRHEAASLMLICVSPQSRGDGVKLIRRFIRWGKGFDSVKSLILSTSRNDDRVHALYEALGFVKTGSFHIMEIS